MEVVPLLWELVYAVEVPKIKEKKEKKRRIVQMAGKLSIAPGNKQERVFFEHY